MLRDLSKILDSAEKQSISESDLQATAATLRANQFIWRDKKGQGRHFDIICAFSEYFEDLFEAFGDKFEIDQHYGFCGVIPKSSRPILKLTETFFLLILAKMHDSEMRKGCVDYGRSKPNAALLLDEYEKLTGRTKPNETQTYQALRRLSQHGIIELGSKNEETGMWDITVLPSIMKVVNESFISDLQTLAGAAPENNNEAEAETEPQDEPEAISKETDDEQ